jgi:hypothetical protein
MHKNTRRFYIGSQAFWQAENGNQLVFTTAKMPQKSRKLSQNPLSRALQQNRWLRLEVGTHLSE